MNLIKITMLSVMAISSQSYSTDTDAIPEGSTVKGASYFVYENNEANIFKGLPTQSKFVYFYSSDGNLILKAEHQWRHQEYRLDPSAPKPQPTDYEIKYWDLRFKGVPGHFVVFRDKNGFTVKSFRCDTEIAQMKDNRKEICKGFANYPLDLSIICKDVQ